MQNTTDDAAINSPTSDPKHAPQTALSQFTGTAQYWRVARQFVPPRAGELHKLSRAGAYPRARACEIHVGKDDWQSNPASVCLFAQPLGIPVEVLKGQGHMLDKAYVSGVLDGWLMTTDLTL